MKQKAQNNFYFTVRTMYRIPVIFIVGDREYYAKTVKKLYQYDITPIKNAAETVLITHKTKHYSEVVVWLNKFYWIVKHIAVLCHESYHAARKILKCVGVRGRDNETMAYLLEYLTEHAMTEILKRIKK